MCGKYIHIVSLATIKDFFQNFDGDGLAQKNSIQVGLSISVLMALWWSKN
jgi:hypothetical protein